MARISGKEDHERHLSRVGEAIRSARLATGLSQEALADIAGIDRSHMGKIERGERNVTLLNLIRIANGLGAKPSRFLQDADL